MVAAHQLSMDTRKLATIAIVFGVISIVGFMIVRFAVYSAQ